MLILHAHTVLPVDSPPLRDGAVAVEKNLITHCQPYRQLRTQFPRAQVIDLTDCVLLPGLINAHTHLELSDLKDRLPYRGNFADWIRRLALTRRELPIDLSVTIADACRQSLASGVTTVADICFKHRAWPFLADQPIRKVCFAEVFGVTDDLESPRQYLTRCLAETKTDSLLTLGFSPHAPYSAGPKVYQLAAQLAAQHHLPLTTHLAETTAEIDFLTEGAGPWLDYLKQIHHWNGTFCCPHQRPVDYFLQLDLAEQPFLLAHVNYLTDVELQKLARSPHSVAYCPRSHAFFDHPQHPFRRMLTAGINVCLGTDSLASNSSLSILDEMRFLHRRYPDLAPQTILQMATINAARALNLQNQIATVSVNKDADLIALPLSNLQNDPLIDILQSDALPKLTLLRGRVVHQIE